MNRSPMPQYRTFPVDQNGMPVHVGMNLSPVPQIYYPVSNPNSPMVAPIMLSPGGGVTGLPQPVYYPVYSPNGGMLNLPQVGVPQGGAGPVVIDFLHPSSMLSNHNHISYDLRDEPTTAKILTTSRQRARLSDVHLNSPIIHPSSSYVKIISKQFPWEIDVDAGDGAVATVQHLITAVHRALQHHISSTEWWIVSDDVRSKVTARYSHNVEHAGNASGKKEYGKHRSREKGILRVDWLLDTPIMVGLERDEQYIAKRVADPDMRKFTWIIKLGKA